MSEMIQVPDFVEAAVAAQREQAQANQAAMVEKAHAATEQINASAETAGVAALSRTVQVEAGSFGQAPVSYKPRTEGFEPIKAEDAGPLTHRTAIGSPNAPYSIYGQNR